MGIFEGITHSEEIEELLTDAQSKYDDAQHRMESQKKRTTKSLESLGNEKVNAWSKDMNGFLSSFDAFANTQMVCRIDESYEFLGERETPQALMINMRNASLNANEILEAGALSIGTGALVGIATYGGVTMFANASTGTAIAALSGAAKKNATLAWLGGGSLAKGGLGVAGGSVVLGGIVIGAVAVVGGIIAGAKGKAKLAEAKKIHAEAESAVSKMDVVITGMEGIETISDNYRNFIKNLSRLFRPYLKEMDRIAGQYSRGTDGKVDFNDLSEMEQRTLHLSWLLAQLYYHILSVPLLTSRGEVNPYSRQLLLKAKQDYSELSGQATQLEEEKRQIKNLLNAARESYKKSVDKYYRKKQAMVSSLVDIGKFRIDLWEKTFTPFLSTLSSFENITVSNAYSYKAAPVPIEVIFESTDSILTYIQLLRRKSLDYLGQTGLIEVALFGGEDFLFELSQIPETENALEQVHKHDMSLWFSNALPQSIASMISFSGVSDDYIETVKQTIDCISGRENLAQATDINRKTENLSNRVNDAVKDFEATLNSSKEIGKSLKKLNKTQSAFLKRIEDIKATHQTSGEVIQYEILTEEEKRVFEMSFVISGIQYTVLSSCILAGKNGGDSDETVSVVATANNIMKKIKKDSFRMVGDDLETSNILWKPDAEKAKYAGFGMMALHLVLTIAQFTAGNLLGLISLVGIAVCCPVFFHFKGLSQSKLFMWRCLRIVASVVVVVGAQIIRLVV